MLIRALLDVFAPEQAQVRRAAPAILDEVDAVLPGIIGKADGHEVEVVIAKAIASQVGSPATRQQINAIIDLYSPVVAAAKAFKRES